MIERVTYQNLKMINIDARRLSYRGGKGNIKIINKNNDFYISYFFSGDSQSKMDEEISIDKNIVMELINAVNLPIIKKSEVFNHQLIVEWLEIYENYKKQPLDFVIDYDLLERLKEEEYLKRKITDVFWRRVYGLTNNYPIMDIQIIYGENLKIEFSSKEQRSFMVPWKIKCGEEEINTSNILMSLAIVKIAPTGFINIDKLIGEEFMLERLIRR